jgi:hypothetical protein
MSTEIGDRHGNRMSRPGPITARDVIPFDPLGRIAAQAAAPYPAPVPTDRDLRDHWAEHYRQVARSLPPEQADDELAAARTELAATEARTKNPSAGWQDGEGAQLNARRIRLEAKVAVFAAEVEGRRATGGAS